jgi:xanthine phosphoribosyltransferase
MRLIEDFILQYGRVIPGNILKVDSFLNHQIDVGLFREIGREFKRLFEHEKITKILTIEASGIGIACVTALYFDVPVLFAKKNYVQTQGSDVYSAEITSYTHERKYDVRVSKEYLTKEDRVLIIDDFLANGQAIAGLRNLCAQAGAFVVGAGAVIEKGFQGGGDRLRAEGLDLKSLAIIDYMDESIIKFRENP